MSQATKTDNRQTVEIEQNGEKIYQVDFFYFLFLFYLLICLFIFLGTDGNDAQMTTSTKMNQSTKMDNTQTVEIEQNGENIYQVDFF